MFNPAQPCAFLQGLRASGLCVLLVLAACQHGAAASSSIPATPNESTSSQAERADTKTTTFEAAALQADASPSAAAQSTPNTGVPKMTPEFAAQLIRDRADKIEQIGDYAYQFTVEGVEIAIVMDPGADRMRLIAPITDASDYEAEHLRVLMEANYHSALDARYALSDDTIYAAFMHPLSSLQEVILRSAIEQVASLVHTYGTSFSSLDVVFPRN